MPFSPIRSCRSLLAALAACLLLLAVPAGATTVRMDTVVGIIDIELFDTEAPATVANFLNYVADGDYDGSFIHRSAVLPGDVPFVIQGGGFFIDEGLPVSVPTDPPVVNEFGRSNLRGTLAMARVGGQPNSATSQWFFNLGDNSSLDGVDGGFTVFGEVVGDGMTVVDSIAALERAVLGASPFNEVPLLDEAPGLGVLDRLVVVNSVATIPEPASALLLATGLAGLGGLGARRRTSG